MYDEYAQFEKLNSGKPEEIKEAFEKAKEGYTQREPYEKQIAPDEAKGFLIEIRCLNL